MNCYQVKKSNSCKSGWKLKDPIGKGASATTYGMCCDNDCKYIAKHITNEKCDFENEVNMQMLAAKHNLGPQVLDSWKCEHNGVIVMEALKMTTESLITYLYEFNPAVIYPLIVDIIKKSMEMREFGICHQDLHLDNVMVDFDKIKDVYRGKYTIKFIDFEKSMIELNNDKCLFGFNIYRSLEDILKKIKEDNKEEPKSSNIINYCLLFLYNTFGLKQYGHIQKPTVKDKSVFNFKSPMYKNGMIVEYPEKITPQVIQDSEDEDFGEPTEAEKEIFRRMMKSKVKH